WRVRAQSLRVDLPVPWPRDACNLVVGEIDRAVIDVGRGLTRPDDETPQLPRLLTSGLPLDAARDVDSPGPHETNRVADVLGRQAAGKQNSLPARRAFREPPIEHLAGPGIGRIHEDDVGRALSCGAKRRVARRE